MTDKNRADALGQEDFEQRLVWHVTLVSQDLQIVQHRSGQPQRNRGGRRLQIRKANVRMSGPASGGARSIELLDSVFYFSYFILIVYNFSFS